MSAICPICAYPLMAPEKDDATEVVGCAHPGGPHYSRATKLGMTYDHDLTEKKREARQKAAAEQAEKAVNKANNKK